MVETIFSQKHQSLNTEMSIQNEKVTYRSLENSQKWLIFIGHIGNYIGPLKHTIIVTC